MAAGDKKGKGGKAGGKKGEKGDKKAVKVTDEEVLEQQRLTGAHEETFSIKTHFQGVPPPVHAALAVSDAAGSSTGEVAAPLQAYTEVIEPYFSLTFYDQDPIQSEAPDNDAVDAQDGASNPSHHTLTWGADLETVMVDDDFVKRLHADKVVVELYGTVEETIPEPPEDTNTTDAPGKKGKKGGKTDAKKKDKDSGKKSTKAAGKKGKGDKAGVQRGDAVLLHSFQVDLRPMLRGELAVTTSITGAELDHAPARSAVESATVTLGISNPLLSERQAYYFNPLAITVTSLEDMPATPLSYQQLAQQCAPVTCKYSFFGQDEPIITQALSHGKKLLFNHTSIFLSGLWDQQKFTDYLDSEEMVVTVHDRDRIRTEKVPLSLNDILAGGAGGEISSRPSSAAPTDATGADDASRPGTAVSDSTGVKSGTKGKKDKGDKVSPAGKKKGSAKKKGSKQSAAEAAAAAEEEERKQKEEEEAAEAQATAVEKKPSILAQVGVQRDTKDPHAEASFDLSDVLAGGRRITMRSAVKPVRVTRAPGQYIPPDRLAPGNFGSCGTTCKVKFEFAIPVPRPIEPPPLPKEEVEGVVEGQAEDTTATGKPSSRPTSTDKGGKKRVEKKPSQDTLPKRGKTPTPKGGKGKGKKGSKPAVVEAVEKEPSEDGGDGDSDKLSLPSIPKPNPRSVLNRPKVVKKRPFAVAVYIMQYGNTQILSDILTYAHGINSRSLTPPGGKRLSLKQLATYELQPEQASDPNLELITGVQVIDPDVRLLILEAPPVVMAEVVEHVASKQHCAGNQVKLLHNREYGIQRREYAVFAPDLYKIKLRESLRAIHHKTEIYSRSQVSDLCYQCIIALHNIRKSDKMRDAYKHIPSGQQLLAMEKKYLGPLTPEDELATRKEYDPSSVSSDLSADHSLVESEPPLTKHRDDIKIDVYNDRFLRHLRDRSMQPRKDFMAETLKKYPGTSRPREHEVPPLQDGLSEEVFIYSGQRLQYTERQKEKIRKEIEKDRDHYYTYSQKYTSLSYCPVNVEELKKEQELADRAKWLDQKGFVTLRQRSKQEELKPDKDLPSARKEELREPWIDPATVANEKEQLHKQLSKSGKRFVTVLPHDRDFDQTNMHLHSIHIGGDASELFLKEEAKRRKAEADAKIIVDPKFHLYYGVKKSNQVDRSKGLLDGPPRKSALAATHVPDAPRSIFIDEGEEWIEPIKRQLKMRDGDPSKFQGTATIIVDTQDRKRDEPVTRGQPITRISAAEKTGWRWGQE